MRETLITLAAVSWLAFSGLILILTSSALRRAG
jgi:hypothetical protein